MFWSLEGANAIIALRCAKRERKTRSLLRAARGKEVRVKIANGRSSSYSKKFGVHPLFVPE
jgi:hypothetical protein